MDLTQLKLHGGAEEKSRLNIATGWIVMGRSSFPPPAKELCASAWIMLLVSLCLTSVHGQQCRIQKCNAEYVAATSPNHGLMEDHLTDVDYCIALRAYSLCTKKTARACRGDLVYHSAVFRIKELFSQHNCSSVGPTSSFKAAGTTKPLVSEICNYESRTGFQKKFAHCGLFGDPHLRTFKDEFQTCKVEGAWPLIDNRYLSVQVTNVAVVLGSSATATSKITVIFKSYRGCIEQKVYQATTEDLPLAFLDGTKSGGEREGAGSLRILEKTGFNQVEIQARYIGTIIIVRQVGKYLTFAIRAPEDTLNFSEENGGLQLCLHGCPKNELIREHSLGRESSKPHLQGSRQPYTVATATEKCRQILQVEDVYFQSCVFDLLTTGDPEFSLAAYGALEDLKALHPNKLKLQKSPQTSSTPNNGALRQTEIAPPLLCFVLSLLLLF
ncbi:RGM domain family, member D isoform X2 [Latimeria chalumnae]|uniref:RGM domain family, member D isoform X2 n=1 Tax=Latimeria chalumnae TaxID=7897 RepID=UPI0003C1A04A|nr:PREDICTED: repulsive guidance molecule A-like isoform X2 [Latimeria chalumnae]|eukprot:XP_006008155.1 PREDICTED: repulsive guidance molecule A-like isoform X2 [Latimeria chalumnae]